MKLQTCRRKTRDGRMCKNYVNDKDGLCYVHKPKHPYTHTCKNCGLNCFGKYCRSCIGLHNNSKVSKMRKGVGVIYG
jgi:hypothetical protein